MPKPVKGSPEQREQHMAEIFRKFYSKPENAGKDLSVQKANKEMISHFGSMLRNKRAYQIRASVKSQVQHGSKGNGNLKAGRHPAELVQPGSSRAAALIEGTPEQLAWLPVVLESLKVAGLAQARVDHKTEAYAVVARA
jgi:hypothetical protein